MKKIAIIDTNVIVSALLTKNSNSATVKILELILSGKLELAFNKKILDEYAEVLSRDKFNFSKAKIEKILYAIQTSGKNYLGIPTNENLPDPKDIVFYEVTMDVRQFDDAFLVTGNTKHFPIKPFVVTPAKIFEILENDY